MRQENVNEDDSNLLDTSAPMGSTPSWMEEMWKEDELNNAENTIEQSPNPVKTAQEITGEKSNPLVTEAKQLTDGNPHNNEINDSKVAKAAARAAKKRAKLEAEEQRMKQLEEERPFVANLFKYSDPIYSDSNGSTPLDMARNNNRRENSKEYYDYMSRKYRDQNDPIIKFGKQLNLLPSDFGSLEGKDPDYFTETAYPKMYNDTKEIYEGSDEDYANWEAERVGNGYPLPAISQMLYNEWDGGNEVTNDDLKKMILDRMKSVRDNLENAIEENPKEAAEILPENSDIQKEAEQAINGGADAEVRNDVVEEALDNGEINDDFFKAFAATMDPSPQEDSSTLKENTQVYGTPSIRRASVSDFRNGTIDKETYRKQLLDQLYDSREALNKASDMMNEAREDDFVNGRGYIGAYSLPAGNAYTRARKELAALDILSDEQLKDKKLVAAVKSIKNTKKMSDEELRDEMSKIASSQVKPEEVIAQSVIPDATPEELIEAPIDYIADEIDWVSEQPTTKDGSIDWDKVKVYKPGEEPYYKVSDESWRDNPDYEPSEGSPHIKDEDFLGPDEYIDENGNIQVDINWKPENADEDFLGPDEYIDENGNIQVDINWKPENADEDFLGPDEYIDENGNIQTKPEDDEIEEAIASEVDEDETIPEEEKEETKRKRLAIFKWSKDVNYGRVQNAKLEASRKELSNAGIKYGKAHNNKSSILGNIGAITLSPISTEHKKEPVAELPRSTASYGVSKPTNDINHKAVSMKNSSGGYNNEGAFTRKAGLLGGKHSKGAITLGKGIPVSKPSSGKAAGGGQQAPKVDMNVLVLKDLIIKKAANWPEHKLEANGYLIVVREDGRVFINRQLFENFIKQNSSKLNELRRIVMEN